MLTRMDSIKAWSLMGFLFFFSVSFAQPLNVKIVPVKINDQITMLIGQGGNMALFAGSDGAFLIDDQHKLPDHLLFRTC